MSGISDALFGKSRQTVLGILFSNPDQKFYLREIAKIAGVSPSSLQKELISLSSVGILNKETQGNLVFYSPNKQCPIYEELYGLVLKTTGIPNLIKEAIIDIEGINIAFIFGSIAKKTEHSRSDVDVMVIGEISDSEYLKLITALNNIEYKVDRDINIKLYGVEEFKSKMNINNSFIKNVIDNPKIFLIGTESDIYSL